MARGHDIVISTQVMIELRAALQALATFKVATTDANLVLDAHELAQIQQFSWFDGLIAEAAIRSHCSVLYSEDFGHGRKFGELAVCNPFRDEVGATP